MCISSEARLGLAIHKSLVEPQNCRIDAIVRVDLRLVPNPEVRVVAFLFDVHVVTKSTWLVAAVGQGAGVELIVPIYEAYIPISVV